MGLAAACAALLAHACHAVTVSDRRPPPPCEIHGDHVRDEAHRDALPGTPEIPSWSGPAPAGSEWWRAALGDRLVKAAGARDAMGGCGSFLATTHYVFCEQALPNESSPEFRAQYRGVHRYVVNESLAGGARLPDPHDLLGLSFGIGRNDVWSELMSSMYFVATRLFDCGEVGPDTQGPIANDWHAGFSRQNPCTNRACYSVPYKTEKSCLGKHGNSQLLNRVLADRKPLSTFVKVDVEGREWGPLEELLKNSTAIRKVRTLDLEVHLTKVNETSGEVLPLSRSALTRNVEIMEKLSETFAVTGSNLEHSLQSLADERSRKEETLQEGVPAPSQDPVAVATSSGIAFNRYSISFINRRLLR